MDNRLEFAPILFLQVGKTLGLDFSTEFLSHCLPLSARAKREGTSGGWRGPLEKSVPLILFFMEAFCPHSGSVLEIGGGTGSVMKAAMHSARLCMVIERDDEICTSHLIPFVDNYYKVSTNIAALGGFGDLLGDDEESLAVTGVPLD